ncbi:MAG TPA: hypothetical protein VEY09_04595 [Pyrinomonadaceae bacterium]|nr:hypothetical protein [Pyrinomonadaceae bacterium]
MRFARLTFLVAGLYGLAALLPQYFLLEKNNRDYPPPVNHPEYYYGFVGLAVAWQFVFLVISRDPSRYRPLMVPAVLEKLAWGVPVVVLFAQGRLAAPVLLTGLIDLTLCALFVASYFKTPRYGSA